MDLIHIPANNNNSWSGHSTGYEVTLLEVYLPITDIVWSFCDQMLFSEQPYIFSQNFKVRHRVACRELQMLE